MRVGKIEKYYTELTLCLWDPLFVGCVFGWMARKEDWG